MNLSEKLKEASWHDDQDNYVLGYKDALSICQEAVEDAITEYKSKLVEGQSSGEWQSILLVNALRLLNDKERNELALSIIERTTPNLIDEACKKQREICAKAYLRYCSIIEIPTSLASEIRTSPSPKESV